MPTTPRILAFAGSLRRDSFNKRLVKNAVRGAENAGAEVTVIELDRYPLPIFDQDFEASQGLPANGRALKDLFLDHHGLLIASPEYNSSITAVLKNTIDWVSRPETGKPPLHCFVKKVAGLLSASPGALGGLRGLVHLRSILGSIKVTVIPNQVAVGSAAEAFAEDGTLRDAQKQESVESVGRDVATMLTKLLA